MPLYLCTLNQGQRTHIQLKILGLLLFESCEDIIIIIQPQRARCCQYFYLEKPKEKEE